MNTEYLKYENELKSAIEKHSGRIKNVNQIYKEQREASRDFYFKLSLLAGGVLSLNVTYIGYLASKSTALNYGELLFTSWALLVLALISAMYRNYFYTNFGHWQILGDTNESRLEQEKAELEFFSRFPESVTNLAPKAMVDHIEVKKNNIIVLERGVKVTKGKEKREERLWVWSQRVSHFSFISGLILIVTFAALNLPIPVQFSLIQTILNQK